VALMALAQRPDVFKVKTVHYPFFIILFLVEQQQCVLKMTNFDTQRH